jgi:hypothetical protein
MSVFQTDKRAIPLCPEDLAAFHLLIKSECGSIEKYSRKYNLEKSKIAHMFANGGRATVETMEQIKAASGMELRPKKGTPWSMYRLEELEPDRDGFKYVIAGGYAKLTGWMKGQKQDVMKKLTVILNRNNSFN